MCTFLLRRERLELFDTYLITSGRPGSARDWTHNLLLPLLHPPSPPNHTFKSHLFSIGRKKEDKKSPFWPPPLKKKTKKHTHKDTTTPIPLTSSSCLFKSKQIKLTKKRKPFSMDQTHDLIILSSLLYKSKGRGGGGSARGLNSTPPSPSLLLPPPSHLNPFLATHELSSSSKKQISVLRV